MTSAQLTDLGAALLGLLARAPGTGYDLTRRMHRPIGYFWSAQHSQIYGELARLEAAGRICGEDVEAAGPRQSRRWTITSSGRRTLRSWVATPPTTRPERDQLALRAYSLWLADPEAARTMIENVRDRWATQLAEYVQERDTIGEPHGPSDPAFGNAAAVRAGIFTTQARIAWCDWVLAVLANGGD